MCGRYTSLFTWAELHEWFNLTLDSLAPRSNLQPRYNAAPTQELPIVRVGPHGRELVFARWGLLPFWVREAKGPPLINARVETVATLPAFRHAYAKRRCLVVADGFYEWVGPPKARLPYRIVMADGSPMTFAGIWETNRGLNVESFAILTTAGNADMQTVHDRMPVILRREHFERWLDPSQSADDLLAPLPAESLRLFRVDPKVNSYKADDASCIEPLVTE